MIIMIDVVEQIAELQMIWDAMTLRWRNSNAAR